MPSAPPPHRRFGLRSKVGLLVTAISVGASVCAGTFAYRQMTELTHDAALTHSTAVLDALSVPAAIAIAEANLPKLDSYVAELVMQRSTDVLILEIVDLEGRVLITSETGMVGVHGARFNSEFMERALRADTPYFIFGPDPYHPRWLDISRPVELGQRWGTLIARFSLLPLTNRLDALTRTIIILAALAALFGWVVSLLVLNRLVVQPVRRLADMARRLGEGEFTVRTTYDRHDEVRDLSESLNTMAERLQEYTSGLETAVQERTADLEQANEELKRLATTDGLTGLRNHRFFQETLKLEVKKSRRHSRPVTVCMVDVDHFKHFNDTHGHPAGDVVLRTLARTLEQRLRTTDIVARYGGEEFSLILLDTHPDAGERTANELTQVIRETAFEGGQSQPMGRVTISVGIASFPDDANSPAELISRADEALYASKHCGRDRVTRWRSDLAEATHEGTKK